MPIPEIEQEMREVEQTFAGMEAEEAGQSPETPGSGQEAPQYELPEPGPEGEASAEGAHRPPAVAPTWALREERERRQAAEERARELEDKAEKFARLDERLRVFQETQEQALRREAQERLAAAKAAEAARIQAEAPDPVDEPYAYRDWVRQQEVERLKNELEAMKGVVGGTIEQQREMALQAELESVVSVSQTLQSRFMQERPDYPRAYAFLEDLLMKGLVVQHGGDVQQARIALEMRKHELVATSVARNERGELYFTRNPAEFIYGMAVQNGYQAMEMPRGRPTAPGQALRGPSSAEQAATRAATLAERRSNAAIGVGSVSGAPARVGNLTPQDIIDMPEGEYSRLLESNPRLVDALLGREI